MRPSIVIVYFIALTIFVAGEIRIRGKVRKRHNVHRRHRAILPTCNFNESLIEDEWSLMEAIGHSKFIFTGKVLSVRKYRSERDSRTKRSNLYTIYLRRILKGEEGDLTLFVKQDGSSESLSGGTMLVERPHAKENCSPGPRPRLSAIFLSDGMYGESERGLTPHLRLLTDPVPLTLYHLDRINAAVKESSPPPPASERLIDIGQTTTPISPSTRGNTVSDRVQAPASADPNRTRGPRSNADSPVSRRLPRSSVRSRNISDLRTRQRVDPSWIVDMENRRIDAEQKLVDAMMIIAEARRDELDISRRQLALTETLAQALRELTNVLKNCLENK
ncbi:unnamed protein product [Colias eurytheme]|nr:unnamed protein product [Colias eurytheme]